MKKGSRLPQETQQKILELRNAGCTYDSISAQLGVAKSTARDYSLLSEYNDRTYNKIVYPVIREWLRKNHLNYVKIGKLIGTTGQDVRSQLIGGLEPRKYMIDGICKLIGKSYEEVWRF